MTSYEIQEFPFDSEAVGFLPDLPKLNNWPVVYVLNGPGSVYMGETISFNSRMRQHVDKRDKREQLRRVRVVLDERFNKSVCLDLESTLIQYAAGDGSLEVLNRNTGVTDADYFDRDAYREMFDDIFNDLRDAGIFQRTIPQIVNSELFKLSPFKALTHDQAIAVVDIMEGLTEDLSDEVNAGDLVFVTGDPGTGKTVVAIYLMKLISDVGQGRDIEEVDGDNMFADFYLEDTRKHFQDLKIALVVPQQALRKSIEKVFKNTPGLHPSMVVSPWDVANSDEDFDIIIVDEAHRLNQYSAQVHSRNKEFKDINARLYGGRYPDASQLDWLRTKSQQVILMFDQKQSVRPHDLPKEEFAAILDGVGGKKPRVYPLVTQMRSLGGNDYIQYVYDVLSHHPPAEPLHFGDTYELGLVDSPRTLVNLIQEREEAHGLSRIVAGYAWKWVSRKSEGPDYDIDLGEGVRLPWNSKKVDWVTSKNAINEAGSIHTIQGYDLNYAGVIIGEDLRFDPSTETLYIDKSNYFDTQGKQNNKLRNRETTTAMLTEFITSIYAVLLTRGIRGTFIHVVNPELREYLGRYFPTIG